MSGCLDHYGEYDDNGGLVDTTATCREGPDSVGGSAGDDAVMDPTFHLPAVRQVDDGSLGIECGRFSGLYSPLPAASLLSRGYHNLIHSLPFPI